MLFYCLGFTIMLDKFIKHSTETAFFHHNENFMKILHFILSQTDSTMAIKFTAMVNFVCET